MGHRLLRALVALAIVLGVSSALADGVPVYEATPAQLNGAARMFKTADELYDAGQYAEAITAFRASHEVVASPNSSYMIARSLRELGRLPEAHAQFRAALREAEAAAAHDEKYAATAEALRGEIQELESNLGRVRIRLSDAAAGTRVTVDELTLDDSALHEPVIVAPGETTVSATSPDGKEVKRTVTVPEGALVDVVLTFSEDKSIAPPAEPVAASTTDTASSEGIPMRTLAYVAGGIGVLGFTGFAVFGSMSRSKFNELRDACPGDVCPAEREGEISDGKRYQTFANVGLAVGILGLGAGVTLFVLSSSSASETASRAPSLIVRPASVSVEGRF